MSPVHDTDDAFFRRTDHHKFSMADKENHGWLQRHDLQVIVAGALTDDEVARIAKAEVPAEYAHLDHELKGWVGG